MKRILFSLLLAFTSSFLTAQILRGDIIVTPSATAPVSKSFAPTPISGNVAGFMGKNREDEFVQSFLPQVGYALTSRFIVGLGFKTLHNIDTYTFAQDVVSPFFRLYAVNGEVVQVYGGVRMNFHYTNDDVRRFGQTLVEPNLGVTIPISKGIRFAPELSYMNNSIGSPLSLDFNFEFVMGRNAPRRVTGGRYDAGRFMVGTQLGSLTVGRELDDANELRLSPEVFFFPVDNFAIGAGAGIQFVEGGTRDARLSYYGAAARYYALQGDFADVFVHGGVNFARDGAVTAPLDLSGAPLRKQQTLLDGGVGIATYLAPNVALETGFGIRRNETIGDTEFMLNSGVRVLVGRW